MISPLPRRFAPLELGPAPPLSDLARAVYGPEAQFCPFSGVPVSGVPEAPFSEAQVPFLSRVVSVAAGEVKEAKAPLFSPEVVDFDRLARLNSPTMKIVPHRALGLFF